MRDYCKYHSKYDPYCKYCREAKRNLEMKKPSHDIQMKIIEKAEEKRNRKKLKRIG